ncbi:MAG: DUF4831 family protein [Tannerella sp.]|jgi:hypothetical protein|nr:DUF4831 family protein [Tannerella sp.]
MKHIAVVAVFMLLSVSLTLAQTTRVEKKIATKATGYGVTYSLPKTVFIITSEMTKITRKAGQFYKYADLYLGIKDAIVEDQIIYELNKVKLTNKGIPDIDKTYIVEFKPGTVAPYVYLTEDGLLCSINTDYLPAVAAASDTPNATESGIMNVSGVYTEELLKAGIVARQAEVAAKQIFLLRERKLDILTGNAENMPSDGDAMRMVIKGLEDQEQMLTSLFVGRTTQETFTHDITLIPNGAINEKVLFRFSKRQGILDADDLGGEPVLINLRITEQAQELPPKEAEKKEKSMKGIIYNMPGKARIEIKTAQNTLYVGEHQVAQFGSQESLAPVMFEDKKTPVKVTFYPETGAIKQIDQ